MFKGFSGDLLFTGRCTVVACLGLICYGLTMSASTSENSILTRRTEALLSLRKGEGLTLGKLTGVSDRDELFGSDDPFECRSTVIKTIQSEEELSLLALRNALAIDDGLRGTLLTERRIRFLQDFKVSMRTLTAREEQGAQVAAYLLPRFIELG